MSLKRKPIREAYADRWVRERCQILKTKTRRIAPQSEAYFFFEDFFALFFFFAGIRITSFWPCVVRYIDTDTSEMSTVVTS